MEGKVEKRALTPLALPRWDALPELDLYMDQLISLLEKYLAPLMDDQHDKVVSRAIINNYVKLKIIPAPEKKRYTRQHIAYLIILCTLKSVLPLPVISNMIGQRLKSQRIDVLYDRFCQMAETRMEQMRELMQGEAGDALDLPFDMAILSAMGAYLSQWMTLGAQGGALTEGE